MTLITMYPETRAPYPLTLLPMVPAAGLAAADYALVLRSYGGGPPITWTAAPQPAGVTIVNADLLIAASSLAAGDHQFTVTATATTPAENAAVQITIHLN